MHDKEAFMFLKSEKAEHSKIKDIVYKDFRLQAYLKSDKINEKEASTIFNMRANTVNGFKMCFSNMYKNDTLCKLGCQYEDSISHAFQCKELGPQCDNMFYRDIFTSEQQQKKVAVEFIRRCGIRTAILNARASQGLQVLDTSTRAAAGIAGGRARGTASIPVIASCE